MFMGGTDVTGFTRLTGFYGADWIYGQNGVFASFGSQPVLAAVAALAQGAVAG